MSDEKKAPKGSSDKGTVAPSTAAAAAAADTYTKTKWNGWGSRSVFLKTDDTNPLVVLHTTGKPMRNIVPFIHEQVNGQAGEPKRLVPSPSLTVEEAMQRLPAAIINDGFVADLARLLQPSQLKYDPESRLTHMFGKNYRDLWRIRKGMISRAPDAVTFPQSHDDCVKIMSSAVKHNVVIIPFGGQTNVTGCIEPSPFETRRMIVAVDMRRMGRMLSIDKEAQTAVFECGVLGPDLDEQLGRHGFMLGHDPDSYVHSTLGGWIGARSSGAASNSYGDIENMVLGLRVVTPKGVVDTPTAVRPCGPDLNAMFVGSEGVFGIITEATVKIERVPSARHYEGWLFPSFEDGLAAFKAVNKEGVQPTIMRLYDEDDTRMSFALKTDGNFLENMVSKGIKQYLQTVKRFDMQKLCLVIMGYEGGKAVVNFQRGFVAGVFQAHNAFCVGAGAGANWQSKKYDLPYVRDFALAHNLWADVFETTVTYADALAVWRGVKAAVREVWASEGKKGWVGCHAAHQYKSGLCLYYTYAGQQFDDNDMVTFLKIKKAATEVMMRHKGTPTHHHGIGYEHVPWMARFLGPGALDMLLRFKADVDPQDICNPYKLLPLQRKPKETDQQLEERRRKNQMFDKMGLPPAVSKL